jgi:hypothetical protein
LKFSENYKFWKLLNSEKFFKIYKNNKFITITRENLNNESENEKFHFVIKKIKHKNNKKDIKILGIFIFQNKMKII